MRVRVKGKGLKMEWQRDYVIMSREAGVCCVEKEGGNRKRVRGNTFIDAPGAGSGSERPGLCTDEETIRAQAMRGPQAYARAVFLHLYRGLDAVLFGPVLARAWLRPFLGSGLARVRNQDKIQSERGRRRGGRMARG